MYDAGKVIFGIIIFALLFTSPIWLNLAGGKATAKPEPVLPKNEKQCVASKEYMRNNHMEMLNSWRDKVVRQDTRFADINGHKTEMSLSKTCLKCHDNKAEFCDRCHNYMDVKPYCWDCHVVPSETKPEVKP